MKANQNRRKFLGTAIATGAAATLPSISNEKKIYSSETLVTQLYKSLTEKQKSAFSKIVKLINMDHLSTLAIPSKKFMFDGSAFGELKIVSAKKISSTPLFDVDNPPEEILELVRYIRNLAKGELTQT